MRFFWILTIAISLSVIFVSGDVCADAPIPSRHPKESIDHKIEQTKEQHQKTVQRAKKIQKQLDSHKKDLVYLASLIKKQEQHLIELEQKIDLNEQEHGQLTQKLAQDKESLSTLILAVNKIGKTPRFIGLLNTDTPLKTAQANMVIGNTLSPLSERAHQFRQDIERLKKLTKKLSQDRQDATKNLSELEEKKTEMAQRLDEREKLYRSVNVRSAQYKAALEKLAKESKSLNDFVKNIEEKQRTARLKVQPQERKPQSFARSIPKTGSAQLPASGFISVAYGVTDEIGARSEGIHIKTRPGSLVVAPMGGVVEYAGTFKGYGTIIILKHQDKYHSLIAGLDRIVTNEGRTVKSGEPIGKTSKNPREKQDLYYELRYKGNPVNPSRKISGL